MWKKKKVILLFVVILIIALLSAGIYFLLNKFNITDIKTLRNFISKFGTLSWVVFLIAEVILSTIVFVIPFEDELWISLAILLFDVNSGFVLSVVGMILTSSFLYLIGNKLGIKVASKIIGKKELENIQNKYDIKSKHSLPLMYLIPLFPHDSLCVVAGLSKMNFVYFFVVTLIMRSFEIFNLCFFASGVLNLSNLSALDWFCLINLIVIDFYLLLKLKNFIKRKISKKPKD